MRYKTCWGLQYTVCYGRHSFLGECYNTLDGGPSGGLAGEGMKAADDVLDVSGPPGFGAAKGTAAYLDTPPLLHRSVF